MCFVFLGTHIFRDKILQFPLHLSKLIINKEYLSSTRFKSIGLDLTMHGSLFKDRNFVRTIATHTKELLKLSNTINTCLIKLNISFYYSLLLNTCECLIYQIYQ